MISGHLTVKRSSGISLRKSRRKVQLASSLRPRRVFAPRTTVGYQMPLGACAASSTTYSSVANSGLSGCEAGDDPGETAGLAAPPEVGQRPLVPHKQEGLGRVVPALHVREGLVWRRPARHQHGSRRSLLGVRIQFGRVSPLRPEENGSEAILYIGDRKRDGRIGGGARDTSHFVPIAFPTLALRDLAVNRRAVANVDYPGPPVLGRLFPPGDRLRARCRILQLLNGLPILGAVRVTGSRISRRHLVPCTNERGYRHRIDARHSVTIAR